MKVLYELLGNVFTAMEPRNNRARTWLDKLILRSYALSREDATSFAQRAAVEEMRRDFELLMAMQGSDVKQKEFYEQAQHLLKQLSEATKVATP